MAGPSKYEEDSQQDPGRRSRSRSPTRDRRRQADREPRSPHRRRRSFSPDRGRDSRSPRRGARDHEEVRHKRKRSPSRSASRSSRSSSASSDDRHRKRHKDRKKRKESSRERKERKKERKEKKKKRAKSAVEWGKYGVLTDIDLYNKEQEFRAWLVEEQMINPETISKDQNKKQFAKFVECYNTATLPHEKYYNMETYQRRMSMIRNGEFVPPEAYDANADLREHNKSLKKANIKQDSYLSKDHLQELRKVQNERIEAGKMKVLGLEIKSSMGVRMDGSKFDI